MKFNHYLTAADLPDGETEVTIVDFTNDKIRREHIPVIYFEGYEKGLALSERLLSEITAIIGRPDPASWTGERLLLYVTGFDIETGEQGITCGPGSEVPLRIEASKTRERKEGKDERA